MGPLSEPLPPPNELGPATGVVGEVVTMVGGSNGDVRVLVRRGWEVEPSESDDEDADVRTVGYGLWYISG